jgi:hypothetical protein
MDVGLVPRTICLILLAVATNACATAMVAQGPPPDGGTLSLPLRDTVPPAAEEAAASRPPLIDPAEAPRFILTPRNVRLEISVKQRRLWVVAGSDTLRSATVSVASGHDLTYGGRTWRFATPRGQLRILRKRTDPVWLPPDWHYAEVAKQHKLKLAQLTTTRRLADGSRLAIRDSVVGLIRKSDTTFLALPVSEHIVFDSTLFIPPISTLNRRLQGELGDYALDLGNGYMLHGTWDQESIGSNTTHGCIRLAERDLAWLYTYVPVGVAVVVR